MDHPGLPGEMQAFNPLYTRSAGAAPVRCRRSFRLFLGRVTRLETSRLVVVSSVSSVLYVRLKENPRRVNDSNRTVRGGLVESNAR